jgi:ABC-type transporter Mla MlaB component
MGRVYWKLKKQRKEKVKSVDLKKENSRKVNSVNISVIKGVSTASVVTLINVTETTKGQNVNRPMDNQQNKCKNVEIYEPHSYICTRRVRIC